MAAAVRYDGTWQGECWAFVKKVVREATGQEMGFDYRQGYFDAGATEVTVATAQPGDIIQIANDFNSGPNADYPAPQFDRGGEPWQRALPRHRFEPELRRHGASPE